MKARAATWGVFLMVLGLVMPGLAQNNPAVTKKLPGAAQRESHGELDELRELVDAQQKQLAEQGQQVKQLQDQLRQLLESIERREDGRQKLAGNAEPSETGAAQAQSKAAQPSEVAFAGAPAAQPSPARLLQSQNQSERDQLKNLEM
ncbi:MAG: hypothetical protein JO356_17780, partial [Acidobacteria bacterium]|nr:hypothetical protein [Acidobacteriota bacterium]